MAAEARHITINAQKVNTQTENLDLCLEVDQITFAAVNGSKTMLYFDEEGSADVDVFEVQYSLQDIINKADALADPHNLQILTAKKIRTADHTDDPISVIMNIKKQSKLVPINGGVDGTTIFYRFKDDEHLSPWIVEVTEDLCDVTPQS